MTNQKHKTTRRQRAAQEEQHQQALRDDQRQQSARVERRRTRLKAAFRDIAIFLLGILASLFIAHKFVGWLPGPHVDVYVEGGRDKTSRCTAYSIMLSNDEPVDFAYFRIQFPANITDYKAGRPYEELSDNRAAMEVEETGRSREGKCIVLQTSAVSTEGVTAYVNGNVITLNESKLPQFSHATVAIMTDAYDAKQTRTWQYAEGTYEYTAFGQVVKKSVNLTDMGTHEDTTK